jgi:hypothetical protein
MLVHHGFSILVMINHLNRSSNRHFPQIWGVIRFACSASSNEVSEICYSKATYRKGASIEVLISWRISWCFIT